MKIITKIIYCIHVIKLKTKSTNKHIRKNMKIELFHLLQNGGAIVTQKPLIDAEINYSVND